MRLFAENSQWHQWALCLQTAVVTIVVLDANAVHHSKLLKCLIGLNCLIRRQQLMKIDKSEIRKMVGKYNNPCIVQVVRAPLVCAIIPGVGDCSWSTEITWLVAVACLICLHFCLPVVRHNFDEFCPSGMWSIMGLDNPWVWLELIWSGQVFSTGQRIRGLNCHEGHEAGISGCCHCYAHILSSKGDLFLMHGCSLIVGLFHKEVSPFSMFRLSWTKCFSCIKVHWLVSFIWENRHTNQPKNGFSFWQSHYWSLE